MNFYAKIRAFLMNTAEEMKKSSWPNRDQLLETTLLTLITLVILAVFVAGIDQILLLIIKWLTKA